MSLQPETTKVMIEGTLIDVPNSFICPITLEVMIHPLITRSGLHFERAAILSWLQESSGTCPLTRAPMRPSGLIPDRLQIQSWKINKGISTLKERMEIKVQFVAFISVSNEKQSEIMARGHAQPSNSSSQERAARRDGGRWRILRRKLQLTAPQA
jgi:hypothetical protein